MIEKIESPKGNLTKALYSLVMLGSDNTKLAKEIINYLGDGIHIAESKTLKELEFESIEIKKGIKSDKLIAVLYWENGKKFQVIYVHPKYNELKDKIRTGSCPLKSWKAGKFVMIEKGEVTLRTFIY